MKSKSSEGLERKSSGESKSPMIIVLCTIVTVLAVMGGLICWLNYNPTMEGLCIAGGVSFALLLLVVVSIFFTSIFSYREKRRGSDNDQNNTARTTIRSVSLLLTCFFATWCPSAEAWIGIAGYEQSVIVYSAKLFPTGDSVAKSSGQLSKYQLLCTLDVDNATDVTHQIIVDQIGGTNVAVLNLSDADLSIDIEDKKFLRLADGSVYTIISSSTSDLVLMSSSGVLYQARPKSTLLVCAAVGIGIGITLWLGYKLGKCLYKIVTNYDNRLSNNTENNDMAYFSPPPSIPVTGSTSSVFSPSLLTAPGTTVISRNMSENNMLVLDISTNGWVDQQGYVFGEQYVTAVYATNLAIYSDSNPSSVVGCRFFERNLTETTTTEISEEPIGLAKTWISYDGDKKPMNALTTVSWRGVRFFTKDRKSVV